MSDEELTHFGVKGMRWGVRKKTPEVQNARYGSRQREDDLALYGKRGVKRINRSMNKGKTHKKAERRELISSAAKRAALAVGLSVVTLALSEYGDTTVASIRSKAAANRKFASATNLLGEATKINAKKSRRGGAYKVTTL